MYSSFGIIDFLQVPLRLLHFSNNKEIRFVNISDSKPESNCIKNALQLYTDGRFVGSLFENCIKKFLLHYFGRWEADEMSCAAYYNSMVYTFYYQTNVAGWFYDICYLSPHGAAFNGFRY